MSLRKSALSGIFWTFIQQVSTQGISFIVSIILARLLLPEEFGLIALLSVFMALGNVLINSGMSQSLIRTTNPTQEDYSTVFFFNMLISVFIYVLMFLLSPLIAKFYNEPILIDIIRIYCLIFIINSLSVIQYTKLTKELNFRKQMIISIPSLILGSSVGIFMAFHGYGVWSLVWSGLIKSAALSMQLWLFTKWKPAFVFSKEKIKYHFNFGYKLSIAAIIDSLFSDIYTIIIGKMYNPIYVGFYNRANTLKQYPTKNFTTVLNQVTFPLFSKIQDDNDQLKNAYKKIMQMAAFLIAPTLLIMAALAEPLFRFLLTEKWLPAVPYFQILCMGSLFNPISVYNLNIITVKGRSDLHLKLSIVKKIVLLIFIFGSIKWGIYGLLLAQIPLSVAGFFLNGWYSKQLINYSSLEQLKDISLTIILAFISGAIVWYIDNYLLKLFFNDIIRLLTGTFVGCLFYGAISYLFKFEALIELKSIVFKK